MNVKECSILCLQVIWYRKQEQINTPAPGGDTVDARLATLMPLTPAPKRNVGGSVYRSEVYGRRLYLVITPTVWEVSI